MKFIEFYEDIFTKTLYEQVNSWLKNAGEIEIIRTEEHSRYVETTYCGRSYKLFYNEKEE